jgi:hypothetical protein
MTYGVRWLFHFLAPPARAAAGLASLSVALAVGCAEEAVEETATDIEAARQEHMQTMQREARDSTRGEAQHN